MTRPITPEVKTVSYIPDPDGCDYCGDPDGCTDACWCNDCLIADAEETNLLLGSCADKSCEYCSDNAFFNEKEVCPDGCCDPLKRTETFQGAFKTIFDEAFNLLVSRQRKYGPENIRQLGLFGVFDRLASDKVERVRRAFNGKIVNGRVELNVASAADFDDESLDDALLDIANYALIMLALKRGVWGLPLEPEA